MAQAKAIRYPIGIQSFRSIIEDCWLYVDKTDLIHQIACNYKYVFLSRPRRFGKSLTASTFASYFRGEKELFKGLAAERLVDEWISFPVFYFDLSTTKDKTISQFQTELYSQLSRYTELYGPTSDNASPGTCLKELMLNAHKRCNQKPVIIIDEYDAPLLNNLCKEDNLEDIHRVLMDFFSPIKSCEEILRFVFITGITKFSQLSIFSTLNNLVNISMMPEYAALCGITHAEMVANFKEGIAEMARRNMLTQKQTLSKLKEFYEGYRFSKKAVSVYNPFSLVTALEQKEFGAHWFSTGTPTYLLEQINRFDIDIESLDDCHAEAVEFDAPTQAINSALPMLYQCGYVTIIDYCRETNAYRLGIPNKEVRLGLFRLLLPYYTGVNTQHNSSLVVRFTQAVVRNDIEKALQEMQTFLASLPYDHHEKNPNYKEKHYHTMFYILFTMFGANMRSEVKTAIGRIDAVLETKKAIYVFELKLDSSADVAINQIENKEYLKPYIRTGKRLFMAGVNFSTERRTLTEWIIKEFIN